MERRPQTLHPIPSVDGGLDESFFITAQHPGMAEDDIDAAALGMQLKTSGPRRRGKRRKRGEQPGDYVRPGLCSEVPAPDY